ncbi:MAG: bifunctional phosphopantothenoylcysteine decarboxylase/phosphopantothenate--cysteine ligase CoaBC [Myxococcota bacterium]|jgi:phosphopantothenoylcysteine decarboxylase/phosphopantothenate--cysteine ligase|nr:bifunctional phosphopantothenoylcysteine decarboxylase/phosphopantothenate--cysteine ligase CoaBC [Myxococcota bacterium]
MSEASSTATSKPARRVLLAVSGGIAAYKAPELVRALVRQGQTVRCALTRNAARFVTPLVLQTVSGHAVRTDLFDAEQEGEIDHIALADWAELVVVAPATADLLAKLAHGIADELVSTLLLATRAPVLVAPAMNVHMWDHPATRDNVALLRARGVRFVGPEAGFLACGWEGEGRMAEPATIAAEAERLLGAPTLAGEVVVVTAGGTREPLDPVRVLANRSSGKMGFEVAAEAARRGAEVVLISGPSSLATPAGVRRVGIETALQMRDAVHAELARCSVFVAAAAVSDFRPAMPAKQKIKKEALGDDGGLVVELVRNPDILAEVGAGDRAAGARSEPKAGEVQQDGRTRRLIVVGFAAESEDVLAAARRKLERKRCDLIVANDVSRSDAGFDVDTNAVTLVWPGGRDEALPLLPKRAVAAQILDRVEQIRGAR